MKCRNLTMVLLLGVILSLGVLPVAATEAGTKTVLLKVHVPFAGG